MSVISPILPFVEVLPGEAAPEEISQVERRADWHTPQDCHKLLDVQTSMKQINERLDKGQARMDSIEKSIADGHAVSAADRGRLEAKLDLNSVATNELLEIIQSGKGFFRWVGKVGDWTRSVILWTLPVATAILAFWYVLTGHQPK